MVTPMVGEPGVTDIRDYLATSRATEVVPDEATVAGALAAERAAQARSCKGIPAAPAPSVNLTPNPDLDEAGTAGWVSHNIGVTPDVWERSDEWAHTGTYSMKHAGTSGTVDLGGGLKGFVGSYVLPPASSSGYAVEAGDVLTASAWCNVTVPPAEGDPGLWMELFFYNAAAAVVAQYNGPSNFEPVTVGEQQVSVTGMAASGAVWAQAVIVMASTTDNTPMEFYADAVRVEHGTTVGGDPAPWPADLAEALMRRVAVNLAARGLLVGYPGHDPEIARLEGPHRRLRLG